MNRKYLLAIAVLVLIAVYFLYSQSAQASTTTSGELGDSASVATGGGIDQWNDLCSQYSTQFPNLAPNEIKAVIMIESSGNPNSSNPSDPSWGLMGITLPIGIQYAEVTQSSDLLDPATNIEAGAGFMSYLKGKYFDGTTNNWIAAYNEGETSFLAGNADSAYVNKFNTYVAQFAPDFATV